MELREKITEIVGEYTATVMVENPNWVFNPNEAIKLADQVIKLIEQEYKPVQLEALTDKELQEFIFKKLIKVGRAISQATIAKNQKGQLYRLKKWVKLTHS